MLSVSFQGARKLRRVLKSKSHRYSLNVAQRLLNEAEQYAIDHQLSESVVMMIHGDDDESVFVDQLEFGKHLSYINNLIAVVQHTLSSDLFADYPAAEKKTFLDRLGQQLQTENKVQLATDNASTDQEVHPEEPTSEPTQLDNRSTQKQDSGEHFEKTDPALATAEPETSSAREIIENFIDPVPAKAPDGVTPKPHETKPQRVARERNWRPSAVGIRRCFVVVGVLAACCILFLVGRGALSSVNQPLTYSELIAKKEYLAAAKAYPKKRAAIESKLASVGGEKTLKKFVATYPSDEGKFDLAFKQAKYSQVVGLSTQAKMTILRKTMLAIAYVKTNQLDQAAVLNADLNSSKLTLAIALGYVHTARFDEATALNKTLNNKSLEKVIDTGRIYQQAIEKYQRDADDETKTATERKTAAANVQAFTHQLQTLGE
ncbi:hypothetical protein [Lacticaseibacillus manihotivorans]|uniref:Uncharacterized protein n=1 Tax=Lacticaseibacillus manihotivorans TaxID=88233 RepID=A0A5P8JU30_9LACO|nr:hypothetical protein [Lacticaseibacillus manihotivorans]QFQ92568.1 hypothetical protein LM010_14755 [Lacticaseibacillus manihotivorans]